MGTATQVKAPAPKAPAPNGPAPTLAQLQATFEKAQTAWLAVWPASAAKAWGAFLAAGGKRGTPQAAEIYTPAMAVLYKAYATARAAFRAAGGTPSIARAKK